MRTLVQLGIILFTMLFWSTTHSAAETAKKKSEYVKNVELMLTSKKESIKLIKEAIDEINEHCCEDNFLKKNKIIEIKNNLEKCLSDKCYDKYSVIFTLPQAKITTLKYVHELDDLLMRNEELKYENIAYQKKINDEIRLKKLQNEKDVDLLKASLNEMSEENIKLKKIVDKMLLNYQKKITNLENTNKDLENKFNTAYEMLPKRSKKKFDETVTKQ